MVMPTPPEIARLIQQRRQAEMESTGFCEALLDVVTPDNAARLLARLPVDVRDEFEWWFVMRHERKDGEDEAVTAMRHAIRHRRRAERRAKNPSEWAH